MTVSKKSTVRAAPNIAFVKYWGARDLSRAVPANPSISMTLAVCHSRSTVEHLDEDGPHEVLWRGDAHGDAQALTPAPPAFAERVHSHLDRLRRWAGVGGRFRLATANSFPAAAGIASSASGFAALTLATIRSLGRQEDTETLSDLARLSGSGSATRSVLGGYVEWPVVADLDRAAAEGTALPAEQIAPASHWDLRDVIALVESGPKETSSLAGHRRAATSPYWEARQRELPRRLAEVRAAIAERDIERLGRVVEEDSTDLHCVAMSSSPPIFYWKPATLAVLEEVRRLRDDGHPAYATMDAGANVHVICPAADEPAVAERVAAVDGVEGVLRDRVGDGPVYGDEHLF